MTMSISSSRRARAGTIGALTFQLLVVQLVAGPIALPGCLESCGDITVLYPFGMGQGCFHEGFNLTCRKTRQETKLFLGDGVEVFDISLSDGTVRIDSNVLQSISPDFNGTWSGPPATGPFVVSSRYNWFVAYGCNIIAQLIPYGASVGNISTCVSMCVDGWDTARSMCSGIARCRASIILELAAYGIQFRHIAVQDYMSPRSLRSEVNAAFIVEQAWFTQYQGNIELNPNTTCQRCISRSVPVVLEWSLHSKLRCQSSNSFAYEVDGDHNRVRCNCSQGYQGNPYIGNGCQDVDECQQPGVYPCPHGTCINMQGTYRCATTKSNGKLRGLITGIVISAGFGLLFSLFGVAKITSKLKQQRAKKLRQKFFKKNHGLLLQQLISSDKDIAVRTTIFSLEELEQATNKFDRNRILGGGGHGMVYKGILSDQRVVAIKKAKIVVEREIDQFINEIVILSYTNHRNVVNLFGCCLETEVPLLVYEFISNGTLQYHLHGQSENPLSWKDRLRIALETARAMAYLHSAASLSVYHRDIKCANVLITDTLTAKVSDFGASRSIAVDETGIVTAVQGTYGYLDPEYYYTSRLTEKSDVYSFGVILAELLTRMTPVFPSHLSEGTSLASHFVSLVRDKRLLDIIDTPIVEEGGAEDAEVVARLATACLSLKGEERPTMRQVETILEDVHSSKAHLNFQSIKLSQSAPKDQWKKDKCGEGTRLYSLEKEFIQSSEIPR